MRFKKWQKAAAILTLGLFLTSCTYHGHGLNKLQSKQLARTQELNQAAYISNLKARVEIDHALSNLKTAIVSSNGVATLSKSNYFNIGLSLDSASDSSKLTSDFLQRNQKIVGEPVKDQTERVEGLLSSNAFLRAQAEIKEKGRVDDEQRWNEQKRKYEEKLINYGTKFEEERNEKISFWTKWIIGIVLVVGGGIALIVIFPPLLGGLIGIIPQLSSLFGVVSKKTFSSVTKGIGEVRWNLKKEVDMNANKTYTSDEVLQLLDASLKDTTSERDRNVIEYIRRQQNL